MSKWENFRKEMKKVKEARFAIRNNFTGGFICSINGGMKVFSSKSKAEEFIVSHNLSSFYQIQFLGKLAEENE